MIRLHNGFTLVTLRHKFQSPQTSTSSKHMAKFELYTSKNGEFRFRLKANNGQIILTSEGYKTKAAARNGITSVGKNAARGGAFETRTGKNGKHYFNLKSGNGQVIGSSQGYATAAGCKKGMDSVMKNSGAAVDDLT
ncbi:MAG: YegP family protein [Rubricoccaceae bacterium]|nr:YegP family protein [Rubricoccaceae bacterium]